MSAPLAIWTCRPEDYAARLPELSALLLDAVRHGAAVNFVEPFGLEDAAAFWRGLQPAIAARSNILLLASRGGNCIGTVLLKLVATPNQPHRADVAKLLVHSGARRSGVGRRLMQEVETVAKQHGRSLLTLDTRTGDHGEKLYLSLGYLAFGRVPRYSAHPQSGALEECTFLYKELR